MIKKLKLGHRDHEFDLIDARIGAWFMKKVNVGRVQTTNLTTHGLTAHEVRSYFRKREEAFSPRTKNATGPVVIDALGQYEARLV